MSAPANHYEEALQLADQEQYQQAYEAIALHLEQAPDDAEVLNDTGVILHCLNRSQESISHLTRAREINGDAPDIIWNLVEAYLTEANIEAAKPLLQLMAANGTINFDVLNRAANILLNEDRLAEAQDMLEWSLRLCPEQEILEPIVEIIQYKIQQASEETSEASESVCAPEIPNRTDQA